MPPGLRIVAATFALMMLGACFLSEKQLIGETARLHGGALALCIADGEPCHRAVLEGDSYLVLPHPEDAAEEAPVRVRFMPLMLANNRPVWLGEAELTDGDDDDTAWAYLVVRSLGDTPEGVRHYDVAFPGCRDADAIRRVRYAIEPDGAYACKVTDLRAFAAYLVDRHGADFADQDWWDRSN